MRNNYGNFSFSIIKFFTVCLLPLFLLSNTLEASELQGVVKDSTTQQPLAGVNIVVEDSFYGTTSDEDGYYHLQLPPGQYKLKFILIGFKPVTRVVKLKNNTITLPDVNLAGKPLTMKGIVVEGDRNQTVPQIDFQRLTSESIKNIPPLGEPDLLNSLTFIPGISRFSDWNASLSFKGTAPWQSAILFDGVELYQPFHFFGILSSFNPFIIEEADVFSSGAPAQYGNTTGGLVNVKTRTYPKPGETGANISLINSALFFQKKYNKLALFVGARKTYFDLLSRLIEPFPYGNVDANVKLSWFVSSHVFTETSVYYSNDFFLIKPQFSGDNSKYHSNLDEFIKNFARGQYNWGNMLFNQRVNYQKDKFSGYLQLSYVQHYDDFNPYIQNYFTDYTARMDGSYKISANTQLNSGLFIKKIQTDYDWGSDNSDIQEIYPYALSSLTRKRSQRFHGGYFAVENIHHQLRTNLGLRITAYPAENRIEPRLALHYRLNKRNELFASSGLYSQNFSAPVDFYEMAINPPNFLSDKLILGRQVNFGIQHHLSVSKTVSAQAYWQKSKQVPDWYVRDVENPDYITTENTGLIVEFKDTKGLLTYHLYYNYSHGEGIGRDGKFTLGWNRKHAFNGIWGLKIANGWYMNMAYQAHSGAPYTPVLGKYFGVEEDEVPRVYERLIYGKRNSKTFPTYSRLDFSIRKLYEKRSFSYIVYAQIINVTYHKNIMRVNWDDFDFNEPDIIEGVIQGYPILPSFGVEFRF